MQGCDLGEDVADLKVATELLASCTSTLVLFEKNIQTFSSHTVSKLGGLFQMKKSDSTGG